MVGERTDYIRRGRPELKGGIFNTGSESDRILLRENIAGEKEAINLYSKDAAKAENPKVRAILEHIKKEEEHHKKELAEMLKTGLR